MRAAVLLSALWLGALSGCAGQRALQEAALAERRLGSSGSDALAGVASLTAASSELARGLERDVAPVASEAAALLASARAQLDAPRGAALAWVIGAAVAIVVAHGALSAWRTRALVAAVHEDVKRLPPAKGDPS
jgi:hypothetical protein